MQLQLFIISIYKALVRPILEYCDCLWDPHQQKYIIQLERVQSFAARVVTKRWQENALTLREKLHWPLLSNRRIFHKICICRRIHTNISIIPCSVFTPHPSTSVRHINSCPLFKPYVKTHHHRSSFFISVIPLWNFIPNDIITCKNNLTFKKYLKNFLNV